MNMQQNTEERLWDYIDGVSTNEEKKVIEKLLENNAEWRSRYHELLEVHQLAKSVELEEPSMRFTKNVMDEIAKLQIAPATKSYFNKNIIRGIAVSFIIMIAGFLVYAFAQADWETNDTNSVIDLNKVDFTKVDISRYFSNTSLSIFLMTNLILGLFLADRYLANKRRKQQKEA